MVIAAVTAPHVAKPSKGDTKSATPFLNRRFSGPSSRIVPHPIEAAGTSCPCATASFGSYAFTVVNRPLRRKRYRVFFLIAISTNIRHGAAIGMNGLKLVLYY
jgi:hypothetical protein